MKIQLQVICLALVSLTSLASANTFPRPSNGKTTDCAGFPADVTVSLTGRRGEVLDVVNWPQTQKITNSKPCVTFDIPMNAVERKTGLIRDVLDINQIVKAKQNTGEISDLSIEAIFFDSATNEFVLTNIFGTIADRLGLEQELLIPDLFADTNGDTQLGDGDVLYSLVDLSQYLNAIPSFGLGESFTIINGSVASLPGMMFSTAPFIFDPGTGFSGTPFSGIGIANSEHGLTAVLEPSTLMLLWSGLTGLVGFKIIGKRRINGFRL